MEFHREQVGGSYSHHIGQRVQDGMGRAQTPSPGRGVSENVGIIQQEEWGYFAEIPAQDKGDSLHVKLCGADVATKSMGMMSFLRGGNSQEGIGKGSQKGGMIEEGVNITC